MVRSLAVVGAVVAVILLLNARDERPVVREPPDDRASAWRIHRGSPWTT